MCNGAVCEFSCFLWCLSGHSTSIPVNLAYFPDIQILQLTASLSVSLKDLSVCDCIDLVSLQPNGCVFSVQHFEP